MVTATRSKSKKPEASSSKDQVKDATPKKLRVSSSHVKDTTPSRELVTIPKNLYEAIKVAASIRATRRKSAKYKRTLYRKERKIHRLAMFYKEFDQLPSSWEYNHKTAIDTHRPKTSPKKKIKRTITRLHNINGTPLTEEEKIVWNHFVTMNAHADAYEGEIFPMEEKMISVEMTDPVVEFIVGFAVEAFNDSYQKYVKEHNRNNITHAVPLECKYYKMTSKYCFDVTIDAIEQEKPGVYEATVECDLLTGARTLCMFVLTNDKTKSKNQVSTQYEEAHLTSDESDPEDFYEISGMVHRNRTSGGGFNYQNPSSSLYRYILNDGRDRECM